MEIAPSDSVKAALQDDRTTILDVRTQEEILETGYLKSTCSNGSLHAWVHVSCTPTECPLLEMTAYSLIRDKTAPVVIHCRSGRRAEKAKEVLESLGYKNILNAGGWPDVEKFNSTSLSPISQ
jgi:phage shock protein E